MKQGSLKVLIVGGGGREHAIAWKLKQSPRVSAIFCAPGNAGIAQIADCVPIQAHEIDRLIAFAKENAIDLAVIGPEGPLADGIVDEFDKQGIRVFGPNKKCAQLEASKAFTKQFLERHTIPTARYQEFTDSKEAISAIGMYGFPMVIKADGLAAGKGVIIAEDEASAELAIKELMSDKIFGSAGDKLVIEEFLTGIEASVLCFVDGKTIVPMASAQDYKKIHDGDLGPNTGGMGTYSPSLIFNDDLELLIKDQILIPTLAGFKADGLDFRGILFIGLMIGSEGPKVIEFNVRFGDPETQSVLMRLETDLLDIMESVIDGRLSEQQINWSDERTICVVLAAGGYPGDYEKGDIISGLESLPEDILVFHAGTQFASEAAEGRIVTAGDRIVTAGGRVLGVCARGKTAEDARDRVYSHIDKINFRGAQYRKDIGIITKAHTESHISIAPVRYENEQMLILDQTLLPGEMLYVELKSKEQVWEAINKLRVRGAPAIGIAAAYGCYVAMRDSRAKDPEEFLMEFMNVSAYLAGARPTAVNLCWALDRMKRCIESSHNQSVDQIKQAMLAEAQEIREEDERVCRQIGENALTLLKPGMGILTHCNAGTIATSKYGTALSAIYLGQERGYDFKVFADETRPLLQGARLTTWELSRFGVDVTLICDNMASIVMKNGWIDAVVVGCDRVAANGDAANKIGTSGVAILAREYGIPFYVHAPISTIDLATKTGEDIHIELRDGAEIYKMWFAKEMAPAGIKTYNPAFDVTDADYITAIITEGGIAYPPYKDSLQKIMDASKIR